MEKISPALSLNARPNEEGIETACLWQGDKRKMESGYYVALSLEMDKSAKTCFLPGDSQKEPRTAKAFDENNAELALFNQRI